MQNTFLNYAVTFFNKLNIPTHLANVNEPISKEIDLGLRDSLMKKKNGTILNFADIDRNFIQNHIIYLLTDKYTCHYIFIPIPAQELDTTLIAGPYLTESAGLLHTSELCSSLGIPPALRDYLNQYLSTLPCISDTSVMEAFIDTLGENLFGVGDFKIEYLKQPTKADTEFLTELQNNNNEDIMQRLEYRYSLEAKVLECISRGDFNSAMKYSSDQALRNIDNRSPSTLRSKKNNLLAFNTVCRKGAELGNVHPIHLDEMSRRMAIKIENMISPEQDVALHKEILKRYCTMVQHNSTTGYSPTMQRVINHITQNLLDTDLTLQNTAESLALNKSYLSTIFKKETGMTFTAFVNSKRLERAIFLLNTSDMQIQDIASSCGIPDVTYFTRIFKAEKGMTPSQYKKMLKQK